MSCPDCGTAKAAGGHFCHNCGRPLEMLTDGLRVGDRRIVTALFADLVGYTKLVDELDPEEVRVRVDAALGVMGQAVIHFDGSLEKFVGDAVLVVFGVPAAHDDDPLRACLCALEMQHALSRYSRWRSAARTADRHRHGRGRCGYARSGGQPLSGSDG